MKACGAEAHGVALLQQALQLAGIPGSEVDVLADMGEALAYSPVAGLPQQQGGWGHSLALHNTCIASNTLEEELVTADTSHHNQRPSA